MTATLVRGESEDATSPLDSRATNMVLLGDVVEFLDHKRRPITSKDRIAGPIPYYGANGKQDSVAGYIFDEPLVLLAEDGGHFDDPSRGIAYRVSGKTWVNNHAHVLRPTWLVDVNYLARVLENYDVRPFLTGTTRSKLTKAGAQRISFSLPPVDEQRRVAAILDKTDELRTKRRQALSNVDALIQSVFAAKFGDVVRNARGWPHQAFEDVAPSRLGKMLDKRAQSGHHLRKYIRNANVQWFNINTSDLAQMDFDENSRSTFELAYGDVLICEGGEPGRAAIWRAEIEDCYYQKAVHRARPNTALATPEYLVYLLWNLSKGGGLADHVTAATIAHLTGEKLKRMKIPVPPLQLQKDFSAELAAAERLKEHHRAQLAKLDALFASLQHRAFTGQL
jgi:type I restriction enzyme S subunit